MKNRNKAQVKSRFKSYIIIGVITILLLFFAGLYIMYAWRCYANDTGAAAFSLTEIFGVADYVTAPSCSVPITPELVTDIALEQIKTIWWIYLIVILLFFLVAGNRQDRDYLGVEKGSADWASKRDFKNFRDITGIPLGKDFYCSINNTEYYMPHNCNEIVIGGSGAGKSFRKIKPDIMQMFGSYVVTDPKGELYRDTAKLLKANGYKVKVLNLINIGFTNTYNPFVYMREEQDVVSIADLFMKNTAGEGEKDDFWSNSAKDLLIAVMIYLWKSESDTKSFGRVIRLVNSITYEDGIVDPTCELARCMQKHSIEYPLDVATVNWASVKGTPEQTMGGIAKSLSTRLGMWAVEAVDNMTATDEMDFDNVGVEKTAIFVITPPARNPYRAIVNMFYSQLFERLMYVANFKHNGKLPQLVSCELDEFANIGKIPNFNETLAVVRSHNIRICIVLQGLSQLKALYEKTWESIIGNCSLFTYLGTNDGDTRKYVSEKLGKTTVRSESKSYNRGGHGGGSTSDHYDSRDLASQDELPKIVAPKGKSKKYSGSCIIFVDEYNPFYMYKYDTLSHPFIEAVGGPKKKYHKNYTDIAKEYENHIKKNEQSPEPSRIEQMMSIDYDKKFEQEQLEQLKLREAFENSDSEEITVNAKVFIEEPDISEEPEEFDEDEAMF